MRSGNGGAVSLANRLIPQVPAEWQARKTWDGTEGVLCTGLIEPVKEFTELLVRAGWDPDKVEIQGGVNQWFKETPKGEMASYFFKVRVKESSLDLPALYAAARRKPRAAVAGTRTERTTVVVLSDVQAGKVGARGGTPELVDRLHATRTKLEKHLRQVKPSRTVLAEAGDLFEGFESGGNPMFTNDLSLAQQMDLAGTEVFEFVSLMARWGRVDVMAVPSNHTAWRRGKQNLGRPSDDLGLHVHRQVERLTAASGIDAGWHYPRDYDESMILDVDGTTIGLVHGNQYSPGKAPEWWGKQQHGGQPVGAADVLVSGHYHHLTVLPTGRNPYTGRAKWWLQAPTLDNGSDWFRNVAGDDSDPGLLVFDVTPDGFDLSSLTIL